MPRSRQVSHQRWIWGIRCAQVRKHTSEKSTLALAPRADVTRSPKRGISGPTKRTHVLQIFLKNTIPHVYGFPSLPWSGGGPKFLGRTSQKGLDRKDQPGTFFPSDPSHQEEVGFILPVPVHPGIGTHLPSWTESHTRLNTLPSLGLCMWSVKTMEVWFIFTIA